MVQIANQEEPHIYPYLVDRDESNPTSPGLRTEQLTQSVISLLLLNFIVSIDHHLIVQMLIFKAETIKIIIN